jgi:hypothetical protein
LGGGRRLETVRAENAFEHNMPAGVAGKADLSDDDLGAKRKSARRRESFFESKVRAGRRLRIILVRSRS